MRALTEKIGAGYRFADELVKVDLEAGLVVVTWTYKRDDQEHPQLQDHFIHEQVLPLTTLIEFMAQACGLLLFCQLGDGNCFLVRCDKCGVLEKITPDIKLIATARIKKGRQRRDGTAVCKFAVAVEDETGRKVGRGNFTFSVSPSLTQNP